MGTKPLKALRGYRASNRGSNRGSRGSNRGCKGSRKNTRGSKRLAALFWCPFSFYNQKKRGVHKISARNSGAGNGCANLMGAWHFLVLSAGKPPCP